MKFFAVFAAIVAVAVAAPSLSSWTLNELSAAIQDPSTDPALMPYLEHALNQYMDALYAGQQLDAITVVTPAGLVPVDSVIPSTVSTWTLSQLSDAIQNPSTNPALLPYLEHALNQYMDALFAGQQLESIAVVVPAGLLPVEAAEAVESPVPAPAVVDTKPEVAAPAASSPLVQIIINIAGDQQSAAPAPAPAVNPTPAAPIATPDAVSVAEIAELAPEPVIVADFAPSPVSVIEGVPEPVSVVEVAPVPEPVSVAELAPVPESVSVAGPVNPIDVVAVAAPEVNPIDLINPIVVQPVIAGQDIVGPIV